MQDWEIAYHRWLRADRGHCHLRNIGYRIGQDQCLGSAGPERNIVDGEIVAVTTRALFRRESLTEVCPVV